MFFHVAFGNTREYLRLEPVQLAVCLISGTPKHGGPGICGMYLLIPPVFPPEPCECIIDTLPKKRESLLGFIQTMKEVFGNCVGELHSRLHIVFIGCEEDVSCEAGCVSEHTGYRESENIKLCPPLQPTGPP